MFQKPMKLTFNQFFAAIVLAVVMIYAGLASTAHIIHSYNETKVAREESQNVVASLLIDSLRAPVIQGSFVEAKLRAESAAKIPRVACVGITTNAVPITSCSSGTLSRDSFEVKKGIFFDEARTQLAAEVRVLFDNADLYQTVKAKIVAAIALNVVLALLVFAVLYCASIILRRELTSILDIASDNPASENKIETRVEIAEFTFLREQMALHMAAARVNAETRAAGEVARQVKHDIRSPLAALNMIVLSLSSIGQEKRSALLAAIERINSIANDCLERRAKPETKDLDQRLPDPGLTVQNVVKIVHELVEEKRIQYQDRDSVVIDLATSSDFGLMAKVCPSKLKRSLSNVINNSVEALCDGGLVTVGISEVGHMVNIAIVDNGHGIPPERIHQLGNHGLTFDKVGGTGLGLYYANKTVQEFGGSLSVASDGISGTSVTFEIPISHEAI